jgi:uncharacterized pyridoxamine 5'-phosphate oxidase family protein
MDAGKCLKILRDIRDVTFATVDSGGRPDARIIDVMIVEGEKLYFVAARGKEFYRQVTDSGEVAISGMTCGYVAVRMTGKVEKVGKEWGDRVFEQNPTIEVMYPGKSRYVLEAFCVYAGKGELFDLSGTPLYRESFAFGGETVKPKGFVITEDCIGCGVCAQICPQKVIEQGEPYKIIREHCLHCGYCQENCPADAIDRL